MPQIKRVAIADDDEHLLNILATRCKTLGLDVRTARDATSALNIIHEFQPDVACLDVSMPFGNGLSVCEMVTTDERLSDMPVIVLTGNTDEQTIRRCHQMRAFYVLKCPDVWPRLEPLLCELLNVSPLSCAT